VLSDVKIENGKIVILHFFFGHLPICLFELEMNRRGSEFEIQEIVGCSGKEPSHNPISDCREQEELLRSSSIPNPANSNIVIYVAFMLFLGVMSSCKGSHHFAKRANS
jgi:hypothetical protein